jgi:hypothetical protein
MLNVVMLSVAMLNVVVPPGACIIKLLMAIFNTIPW